MKKSIDLNHYKYIMFVDASGDDGYSFKETSSAGSGDCQLNRSNSESEK